MLLNIAPIENMVKRDFIIKIKSCIKEMVLPLFAESQF